MHQRPSRLMAATGGVAVLLGVFSLSANPAQAAESCAGRTPTIVGTAGDDTLHGTQGDDVIFGLAGTFTALGQKPASVLRNL